MSYHFTDKYDIIIRFQKRFYDDSDDSRLRNIPTFQKSYRRNIKKIMIIHC